MHDVDWNTLSIARRRELCEKAGLAPSVAKYYWNEHIPQTKLRIAVALEDLSGGTASLGLADADLLEYRQWIAEGRPTDFL